MAAWGLTEAAALHSKPPLACCCCRMGYLVLSRDFTDWNESFESFDQRQLHKSLLRGIYAYGEHMKKRCICMRFLVFA